MLRQFGETAALAGYLFRPASQGGQYHANYYQHGSEIVEHMILSPGKYGR